MNEYHNFDLIKMNLIELGYDPNLSISNLIMHNENHNLINIYKVDIPDSKSKIIKIRDKNSINIKNALTYVNCINDKENFIEKYTAIHELNDFYYLFTDYIEGYSPIDNKDVIMPEVFSKLANIHTNNKSLGQYFSKYSDGRISESIDHMIMSEVSYHLDFLETTNIIKNEIESSIVNLNTCIPCLIHEDVHPGNVMVTKNEGDIKLIDCEWIHPGINIYDFEYIDLFEINNKWWNISSSGIKCYRSYFNNLDMDHKVANDQIKAFEILKLLRFNTYIKYFKIENKYHLVDKTLRNILEFNEFI